MQTTMKQWITALTAWLIKQTTKPFVALVFVSHLSRHHFRKQQVCIRHFAVKPRKTMKGVELNVRTIWRVATGSAGGYQFPCAEKKLHRCDVKKLNSVRDERASGGEPQLLILLARPSFERLRSERRQRHQPICENWSHQIGRNSPYETCTILVTSLNLATEIIFLDMFA